MKFLIWFGLLLVATLINAFIGVLIGFSAGWLIIYLLVSFLANKLCKKWDEHQNSSDYSQENNYQQQQQVLQAEAATRRAKIEELSKVTKQTFVCSADIESFLESAAKCSSYEEMLMLWDSLDPVDNETNAAIRNDIKNKYSFEKMYGPDLRSISRFLATLRQTYGTAVIETTPSAETPEEDVVEQKTLTDLDVQFDTFLEEAAQCSSYQAMLELWDSRSWDSGNACSAVRETIVNKVSTERMYGVIGRGIPNFLEKLRQIYDTAESTSSEQSN